MELCRATSLSWTNSFAAPLFHIPHSPSSIRVGKRYRVMSINSSSSNGDSNRTPKANQMVVSITGATGFVGKRLVQRLLADNHSVCVLTRSRSKAQVVFPGKKRRLPIVNITEEGFDDDDGNMHL